MGRKRDLIISWRYASLAMNWEAIKQGVIVHLLFMIEISKNL
jgi:hypothetical protein